jgi:hypothetical protein
VTHAPMEFVNGVDYQPIALLHRLVARDHDVFAKTLAEALAKHGVHWGDSTAPRARVAPGPVAIASIAFDCGFPLPPDLPHLPHLPQNLLNRERIEEIPSP